MTILEEGIADCSHLRRIVYSSPGKDDPSGIRKATVEPVIIRRNMALQFTSYDAKKAIVKNADPADAPALLAELLKKGFRCVTVLTDQATIQIDRATDGSCRIRRSGPQSMRAGDRFSHDREKPHFVTPADSAEVLGLLGFLTKDGGILPSMQRKYRQVDEFLRIFEESSFLEKAPDGTLEITDCGSGNGYLTFLLFHYLTRIRSREVRLTGVDRDPDAVLRGNNKAEALGYAGMRFIQGDIGAYSPATPPAVVLSLHACDTATDEAIAHGIRSQSSLILCAPCCHHHLNRQLRGGNTSPLVEPLAPYGMILEKMGDALTDALRALILSIMGWRVNTIKFVDPENTERNLLIKAERQEEPSAEKLARRYVELKEAWHVTPYLEEAVGDPLRERLARP